jgi:hypothetical protein
VKLQTANVKRERVAFVGNRQSAIGNRQSAKGNRQKAIGNRQKAKGKRQKAKGAKFRAAQVRLLISTFARPFTFAVCRFTKKAPAIAEAP